MLLLLPGYPHLNSKQKKKKPPKRNRGRFVGAQVGHNITEGNEEYSQVHSAVEGSQMSYRLVGDLRDHRVT